MSDFADLHRPGDPLLLPNPWDVGSAKILASLGFQALATTSSGFAMTLGRPDGGVTRAQALAHAADIVAATPLPVSADLENGFSDDPADVAALVRDARAVGLAGCSIEDFTGHADSPIYERGLAVERVRAAAEVSDELVLTARCENYLHGRPDLTDTIERLQAFAAAGADVVYAPGLTAAADIRAVVGAVPVPVNVLLLPGTPTVAELASLGVGRISVGGALAAVAYGALAAAATDLLEGSSSFLTAAAAGHKATQAAAG